MQRPRSVIARALRKPQPNREVSLQLAHAPLRLVCVNRLPHIRRPVFVKLARIFHKKYLIGIELEIPTLLRADRHRIRLAIAVKHRHHLLRAGRFRRLAAHYIFNLQLLERTKRSRLMRKVRLVRRRIVLIVNVVIADLHPHRLLHQFARRLQIVRMQLLRRNVVVRLQRRLDLGPRILAHRFVPLVNDVGRPPACNRDPQQQHDLQLLSRIGIQCHD